jgi:hypothetical protein
MKRSEMLEKMVFSMELHAGNDPAWLDQMPGMKAGALDYADKILRDLEEAGMLPPETKATPSDLSNTGFTQEFLDEHNFTISKWESEDEK